MEKNFKWDYIKFKKFDNFIQNYKSTKDLLIFLNKNIIEIKKRKEIITSILKLSQEEQLLLFYLKINKNINNNISFYKDYLEFCKYYYNFLNTDLYEEHRWIKQTKYYIGRKNIFLNSLNKIKENLSINKDITLE